MSKKSKIVEKILEKLEVKGEDKSTLQDGLIKMTTKGAVVLAQALGLEERKPE